MNRRSPVGMRIAACMMILAALVQLILLLRYLDRFPRDVLGISLSLATIVLFLVAAIILLSARRSQRSSDP